MYTVVSLFSIIMPIFCYLGTCTVLENPITKQRVVLYGDCHNAESHPKHEQIERLQTSIVHAKIKSTLAQPTGAQKTLFLYEGIPSWRRENLRGTPQFLLHLSELHDFLIESQPALIHNNDCNEKGMESEDSRVIQESRSSQEAPIRLNLSLIDIDNRHFLFIDMFNYLVLKDHLKQMELNSDEAKLIKNELQKDNYEIFSNQDDEKLYPCLRKEFFQELARLRAELEKAEENKSSTEFVLKEVNRLEKALEDITLDSPQPLLMLATNLFDLNALVIMIIIPASKYVFFAGTTHCDHIRAMLKDGLGYHTVYSTTNGEPILSETIDPTKYLAGIEQSYELGEVGGSMMYVHYNLPENADFDFIDNEDAAIVNTQGKSSSIANCWQQCTSSLHSIVDYFFS